MLGRILNRGPPKKWSVDLELLSEALMRLSAALLALFMVSSIFHGMETSSYGQFPTPPEGGIVKLALYQPHFDRGDMKLTL
jgi:hypothetical protein